MCPLLRQGPVAQLGARFNRTEEVAGSNPARSTETRLIPAGFCRTIGSTLRNARAGVVSNLPESEGRRLEASRPHPQSALCRTRLLALMAGRTGEDPVARAGCARYRVTEWPQFACGNRGGTAELTLRPCVDGGFFLITGGGRHAFTKIEVDLVQRKIRPLG